MYHVWCEYVANLHQTQLVLHLLHSEIKKLSVYQIVQTVTKQLYIQKFFWKRSQDKFNIIFLNISWDKGWSFEKTLFDAQMWSRYR